MAAPEVSSRSPRAPLSEMTRMPTWKDIGEERRIPKTVGKVLHKRLTNPPPMVSYGTKWGGVGASPIYWLAHACPAAGRPILAQTSLLWKRKRGYGLQRPLRTCGGRPRSGGDTRPLPPRVRRGDSAYPEPGGLRGDIHLARLRRHGKFGDGEARDAPQRSAVAPRVLRPFLGRRAGPSGAPPDSGAAPAGRPA